MLIMFAGSW